MYYIFFHCACVWIKNKSSESDEFDSFECSLGLFFYICTVVCLIRQKKGINNKIERLTNVMALLETHSLKLSFKQSYSWSIMKIENISITLNIDVLHLKIVGKDTHCKWQLYGPIQINNDNLIVCFLNKVYESKKIHKGDKLFYKGIFDEKDLKFTGKWQYEKIGLEGEWEGQFN